MDDTIKKELFNLLNRVTRADLTDENGYDYYILDPQELITLKQKLKDAEKWEKVEEIAKRNWTDDPCEGCPVEDMCDSADSLCGQADSIVDAFTEKEANRD